VYEIPAYLLSLAAGPPQADTCWTDALTCRRLEPLSHQQDVYQFSVGPWRLAEFLWPNAGGRQFPVHRRWLDVLPAEGRVWAPSLYMGLVPLLLAFSAMRFRRADPRIVWWSWSVVLAVLAGFGWFGPGWLLNEFRVAAGGDPARPWLVGPPCGGVYWLASVLLPGYVYFRYPAKLFSVAALGLSLLAAEGWDRATSGDVARTRRWLLGLAGLSLLGAGVAAGVRPWWPQWLASVRPDPVFGPLDAIGAANDLLLALLQTAAGGLVAWWLLGRLATGGGLSQFSSDENGAVPLRSAWVLPTLLLLTVVDLGLANRWMVATAPARDWQTPSPLAERIRQDILSVGSVGNALRGVPGTGENRISPLATERHAARSLQGDSSPFRLYRDPFWLPPSWRRHSSADRLEEALRWDCRTLAPKHNLSAKVALANVAGTMMDYDYEVLLEIPWDQSPAGVELPDLPFSLPLGLELTGARYLVLPGMSPGERARFASIAERTLVRPGGLKSALQRACGPTWLDTPGEETVSLWFNPAALPRAWIVHDLVTLPPLATGDPRAVCLRTEQILLAGGKLRDLRRSAVVETAVPLSHWERVGVRGSYLRTRAETSVAFRSAKERGFRGAKGDNPTDIDAPVLRPGNGVEPDVPTALGNLVNAGAEACNVVDVNPQRVEVEAELTRPGLVVLGDQYDPGWQLEVRTAGQGQRPARTLQTDRVLRGVWLPPGRHRLIYTYRPATFYLGAAISLAAWLAAGLAVIFLRSQDREHCDKNGPLTPSTPRRTSSRRSPNR
jgi:hypothetical protein